MEKIIADSPSVSQWKERKIGLAKELRKFGIDIDNDIAMRSLLVETYTINHSSLIYLPLVQQDTFSLLYY
jgi:hypothetical protein